MDAWHLRQPRGQQLATRGSRRRPASSTSRTSRTRCDNLLHFNRQFGSSHRLDLTGLYSLEHDHFTKDSLYATQLPYPTQLWYDLGSGTAGNDVSRISDWTLESYMGRANYTLIDRYSFSFTGRSDGSSRLAPGHKWAFFPSAGFAWQLGDESFMRRFPVLNSLKVHSSYGTTGNTAISPYQTEGTLASRFYTFGTTRVQGYKPGSIPNPDLGWERTDQMDAGLDYSIINDRLSGTIDLYRMNTHDLLLTELLPVTSGFTSTLQNVGATKNSGIELSLSTLNIRNWHGMSWSSDVNWAHNKNSIVALASGAKSDVGNVWFVGQPINIAGDPEHSVFYDWKYVGVWQYADSVLMKKYNANGSTFKVGDPKVADINGDGKIDANDRTFVGTGYPAWTGSLSNRLDVPRLGRVDAGDGEVEVHVHRRYAAERERPVRQHRDLDYWTPTNPTNANPAPNTGGVDRLYATTRLYTDGSNWRIRNITAGTRFNEHYANRLGLRGRALLRHRAGAVRPLELPRHRSRDRRASFRRFARSCSARTSPGNPLPPLETRSLQMKRILLSTVTLGLVARRGKLREPRRKADHWRQ